MKTILKLFIILFKQKAFLFTCVILFSFPNLYAQNNLALGQPTSQSTLYRGFRFPSDLAVDGDINNFTHTETNTSPSWWRVDLGDVYDINQIVIYNRQNCCPDRLSGSQVMIGVLDSDDSNDYEEVFTLDNGLQQDRTGLTVRGRYVMVYQSGTSVLSLGEVQVYGSLADVENPTPPTTLTDTDITDTSITLSWSGATDNIGISNYKVYNGTNLITTLGNVTSYEVTGLLPSTEYSLRISALDAAENESVLSTALIVSTGVALDTQNPNPPTSVTASNLTDTSFTLNWSGATDNIAVTGYKVYNGSTLIATLGDVNSYEVTGLTSNTQYFFRMRSLDAASNESEYNTTVLNITTEVEGGNTDVENPNPPTSVTASNLTNTSFTLNWSGATDNIAVTGYKIYNGSTLIATLGDVNSYEVTGLTENTQYFFRMRSLDAAFNESEYNTTTLNITTEVSGGGGNTGGGNDTTSMWSLLNSNVYYTEGNVGIGTTTPDQALTVKGQIHAEEVKIDLSVPAPDYVFKSDYDLISLRQVQEYIHKHGHLPNIPSAKEMETNGVALGDMEMKLLEKIEELTLYMIELKKENDSIKKQLKILLTKE